MLLYRRKVNVIATAHNLPGLRMQVIGYIRLCRPGSILGPQQIYLHEQQARMWSAGNHQGQPTAAGAVSRNIPGTVPASLSAPARSRSVSSSQTHAVTSLPPSQSPAVSAYATKPPACIRSSSTAAHPASVGFAAVDSLPSRSIAQLRRLGSMPARVGSSFGASSSTRSPSSLLSRRSDSAALAGELPSP